MLQVLFVKNGIPLRSFFVDGVVTGMLNSEKFAEVKWDIKI